MKHGVLAAAVLLLAQAPATLDRYFETKARLEKELAPLEKAAAADGALIEKMDAAHAKALKTLEPLLLDLFGKERFRAPGTPTLSTHPPTLLHELGWGCVDGVKYDFTKDDRGVSILVTDLAAVRRLKGYKATQDDLRDVARIDTDVACDDARHSVVVELDSGQAGGLAFLSYVGQEIGFWPPNEVIALSKKGSRIYVARQAVDGLPSLSPCEKAGGSFQSDADLEAYLACYGREIHGSADLKRMEALARSLVQWLPE